MRTGARRRLRPSACRRSRRRCPPAHRRGTPPRRRGSRCSRRSGAGPGRRAGQDWTPRTRRRTRTLVLPAAPPWRASSRVGPRGPWVAGAVLTVVGAGGLRSADANRPQPIALHRRQGTRIDRPLTRAPTGVVDGRLDKSGDCFRSARAPPPALTSRSGGGAQPVRRPDITLGALVAGLAGRTAACQARPRT
jgi:hypothetical protein